MTLNPAGLEHILQSIQEYQTTPLALTQAVINLRTHITKPVDDIYSLVFCRNSDMTNTTDSTRIHIRQKKILLDAEGHRIAEDIRAVDN